MTEARRLLAREAVLVKELKRCVHVIGVAANQIAPAYRGKNNVYDEAVGSAVAVLADISTAAEELLAREGELVAALEPLLQSFDSWCRLDRHGICRSHLNDKPCTVVRVQRAFKDISRAALCSTCGGTRVAPGDPDLGGSGVTMSSCPDCVSEEKRE